MSAVPRPTILPSALPRLELRRRLRRHDVEVAVEVDGPRRPRRRSPRTTHGSSSSRAGGSSISSGDEAQPRHRVAQHAPAPAEPATRRVLAVDRDELLEQRRHLVGARLEPGLHVGSAGHQRLMNRKRSIGRAYSPRIAPSTAG